MKSWDSIKEEIYYEDGSLRDIYIFDTNKEDWRSWSNLVNEKFEVEFYNGRTQEIEDKINIEEVFNFWADQTGFTETNSATIKLGEVLIKCYFFIASEIEDDIDPREVKTEENHKAIMEYLQQISKTLKKKVVVTSKMAEEDILLEV